MDLALFRLSLEEKVSLVESFIHLELSVPLFAH